jgi:hypothetical protein
MLEIYYYKMPHQNLETLNYLKYQEKLDLNQVKLYAWISLHWIKSGWFSYENNNYVGTFKPKNIQLNH